MESLTPGATREVTQAVEGTLHLALARAPLHLSEAGEAPREKHARVGDRRVLGNRRSGGPDSGIRASAL